MAESAGEAKRIRTTQASRLHRHSPKSRRPARPAPKTTLHRLLIVGLAGGMCALLGLAPVSAAMADRAPIEPAGLAVPIAVLDTGAPRTRVRELPVGLDGARPTHPDHLRPLALAALGAVGARQLAERLEAAVDLSAEAMSSAQERRHDGGYPGTYRWVERLLDAAPDRARSKAAGRLGAALVALAAARRSEPPHLDSYSDAAPIAYALLTRARAATGCDAEINLLLLLTADKQPHDDHTLRQGVAAQVACPGDPTPGWLLGQFQSQRALVATLAAQGDQEVPGEKPPADRMERARRTFAALVNKFPGSGDVWTGKGDMHLRAAQELAPSQPFTSRQEYRQALSAYERAGTLGSDAAARVGTSRALMGLGEPTKAAPLAQAALAGVRYPGPLLNLLIQAQGAARDFAGAEATGKAYSRLGGAAHARVGPLFPRQEALSLLVSTSVVLRVNLAPCCGGSGGGDAQDVSFIPQFREVHGVTGYLSHCPEWSWRRDAVLAGHAGDAAEGYPETFVDTREGFGECFVDHGLFERLVRVEAGLPLTPLSAWQRDQLQDARQNLWRWAGDLDRAAAVARSWDEETQHQLVAPQQQLGEIYYLQRRYQEAAAAFDLAARRSENGYLVNLEGSQARLCRGTALFKAGRFDEASRLLRTLDRNASMVEAEKRLGTFSDGKADDSTAFRYAVLSYYTNLQLADAERRAGHLDAAVEDYAAALERMPLARAGVEVFPGVALNNMALAEMALGRNDQAAVHSRQAVAADPANPVFLLTAAAAVLQAGDEGAAVELNARALEHDPTAFPAANNLGVQLARSSRTAEAVREFRKAVGARPDYALGWFNLGVLQSQRGPRFLLQAQGALAKAFQLEPRLSQHARELTLDEHVYRTDLDLSKPLPAGWGIGAVERRQPLAAIGLFGLLAVAVGLSRGSASINGDLRTSIELAANSLQRPRALRHRRHLVWALLVTLLALAPSAIRHSGPGLSALVVYQLSLLLLIAAVVTLRHLLARRMSVRAVQRSWPPGLAVGLVSGAVGMPWTPLPYLRVPPRAARLHLVAPLLLATVSFVLLLQVARWQVPLTQAIALAALTMNISLLLPVRPMDGAKVGRTGTLVGLGAAVAALLLALGLL